MKDAKSWLQDKNRSYAEGIEFLKNLEPKDANLNFLRSNIDNPDTYKKNLLQQRIAYYVRLGKQAVMHKDVHVTEAREVKINTKAKGNDSVGNKQTGSHVKIDDNPSVRYELLPPVLQVEYDSAKTLGRRMVQLHESLKTEKNKAAREQIAQQLETCEDQRRAIWKKIDAWYEENKEKLNQSKPAAKQTREKQPVQKKPALKKVAPKKTSKKSNKSQKK